MGGGTVFTQIHFLSKFEGGIFSVSKFSHAARAGSNPVGDMRFGMYDF